MSEQSKPAQTWARRIAVLRDGSARYREFAELLATVDPRWRDAIEGGIYGAGDLAIGPSAGPSAGRASLRVRRTTSGFSMDLRRREPASGSVTAARARPTLPNAPRELARMLGAMFDDREATHAAAASSAWDDFLDSLRDWAAEDAAKADLLESVQAELRERCEIYDNGQAFGITGLGDAEDASPGIRISRVGDGWSFIGRAASPAGGTTIIGQAAASAENAAETLNGLLRELVSRLPAPELSAQDAYRRLLRDHIGPALRGLGYQGSTGTFERAAGEYRVGILFQKSRWSTRARVDYLLNIHVRHLRTAALFNQADEEALALGRVCESPSAGMYHAQFPRLLHAGSSWISLRPGDDLQAHAASLLAGLRAAAFPIIDAQLRLPLPGPPTPPAVRPRRPS